MLRVYEKQHLWENRFPKMSKINGTKKNDNMTVDACRIRDTTVPFISPDNVITPFALRVSQTQHHLGVHVTVRTVGEGQGSRQNAGKFLLIYIGLRKPEGSFWIILPETNSSKSTWKLVVKKDYWAFGSAYFAEGYVSFRECSLPKSSKYFVKMSLTLKGLVRRILRGATPASYLEDYVA